MDIALHDTVLPIFTNLLVIKPQRTLSRQQLDAFTVGLIDGNGSLQVNHLRYKILQFRLIVKLADKPLNFEMLSLLASIYGGTVRRFKVQQKSFVEWVINDQKTLLRTIVPLFKEYPPLTTRMRLQLEFFNKFITTKNIDLYFQDRGLKYNNRDAITPLFLELPSYFADWLAGFIEAEGCFSNRQIGTSSFSIAQNFDLYLLEAIRDFYEVNHLTIVEKRGKVSGSPLFELSIASYRGVNKVISHCAPLLQGYKYVQLAEFVYKSKHFKNRVSEFFVVK